MIRTAALASALGRAGRSWPRCSSRVAVYAGVLWKTPATPWGILVAAIAVVLTPWVPTLWGTATSSPPRWSASTLSWAPWRGKS